MASVTPPGSPMHSKRNILEKLDDVCCAKTAISTDHSNVHLVFASNLDFMNIDFGHNKNVIVKTVPLYSKEDQTTRLFYTTGVGPNLLACITDKSLGIKYMILEFLGKNTLVDYIAQGNHVPYVKIKQLLCRIAGHGLYHKDLNLNNFLVTPDGLKVIDFGKVEMIHTRPRDQVECDSIFISMYQDVCDHIKHLHIQLRATN